MLKVSFWLAFVTVPFVAMLWFIIPNETKSFGDFLLLVAMTILTPFSFWGIWLGGKHMERLADRLGVPFFGSAKLRKPNDS